MHTLLAILISALTVPLVSTQQTASQPPSPNPCLVAEQTQMAFWPGKWDLTWPGQKQGEVDHGANSIQRVLDGCVIEENFSGGAVMHLRGRSLSIFDTISGKWKQTWVDNEGGYLDFTGDFANGQMILQREFTQKDGARVMQRMVWKNISATEMDWSWEASRDGGKTWQVNWPIHYKRKS